VSERIPIIDEPVYFRFAGGEELIGAYAGKIGNSFSPRAATNLATLLALVMLGSVRSWTNCATCTPNTADIRSWMLSPCWNTSGSVTC
jgi:hypothetical protein